MSTAKGEYITIEIAPGTYEEEPNIEYKGSANIHLKGTGSAEYGADVRIIGSGSDMQNESKRSVLEIYKGDWIIENITIEHKDADTKNQAEALGHQSNGTLAVKNCSFISRQDTIRTQGKAWFYQCYIEGTIDFLWMETPGKVALYEDCRLRAVSGHVKDNKPVKSVYFAAPRASSELTEVFKGLVMYNCILEVESGLDAYFARNPWNKEEYFSTFYNQVAVVASKVYGEVNSDIWKYKANGTANQQFVGFKTDESFHESSSRIGARLTKQQVADEYSGRRGILNRYYDLTNKVFSRDSGSNWDIDELIEKAGWKVAEDTSKDKLDTDVSYDGASGTYDFNGVTDGSAWTSEDGYVSTSGFTQDGKSHGLCGSASSSITVRLAGISRLGLQLCQYSKSLSCTIKNAVTGEILHTIEDIKADSDGETNDFYYTTPEPVTVKIEFAGSGQVYIHGISVTNFDEFVPVTGVSVTGDSSVEVAKYVQLTASVEPENATNKAVKWSSSDKNLATVDSKGKVYARGAGTVTITATSAENEALSGTFEIIVTPEVANDGKTGVTWDFNNKGSMGDATFGEIFDGVKFPADDGFYADDSSKKIDLKISGTFKSNGNCAQHGDGTEIKVPVVTEGDSIYVTGFPGYTNFTIGGTTYTDGEEHRYDATAADVAAGYVTITGNSNQYILKIVARYTTLPNKPEESAVVISVYDFTESGKIKDKDGNETTEATVSDTGWTYHGSTYGLQASSADAYVTFPVLGDSVIGIQGYEGSGGTFDLISGETVVKASIPAKTSKGSISTFFIYKGEAGTLKLKVSNNSNVYLAKVQVKTLEDEKEGITSISVNDPGSVTLAGTTMTAAVTASYCGSTAVTWSVSDAGTTGATIDAETGVLTVTAAGTLTVKATSVLDPSKSAERTVTVSSYEVNAFADSFVEIDKNSSITKTTTGSTESIKYGTADEAIATVNESTGEVTGVKAGFVKIYAYNEADTAKSVKAEYTVCVNPLASETYTWTSTDYNTYGQAEVTGEEFTYNSIKFDTTGTDTNGNQARVKKHSTSHIQIFGGTIIKIPVDSAKTTTIVLNFSANVRNVEKVIFGTGETDYVTLTNSAATIEDANNKAVDGYIPLTIQCKSDSNTYIGGNAIVRTVSE